MDTWFPLAASGGGALPTALVCFPFAGGGAGAFRGWERELDGVDVLAAQPPGRETRLREALLTSVGELADAALEPVLERVAGRPYALFGHSLGALVCFELVRRLEARGGPLPTGMFASGGGAPRTRRAGPDLHRLEDAELSAELARMGGTPPQVLASDELMALFLPILRADFRMSETYAVAPDAEPVPVPITGIAGAADGEVVPERVAAWEAWTSARFRLHVVEGDHFFLQSRREAVLTTVTEELACWS